MANAKKRSAAELLGELEVEEAPAPVVEEAPAPVPAEVSEREKRREENRAKRTEAILSRLEAAKERFRRAYHRELTKEDVAGFAEDCRRLELFDFMEKKVGRFLGADQEIIRGILKKW